MDKKAYATILCERIQTLADNEGVSINRLLKTCGLPSGFINNIKGRNSIPVADSLVPIADYFGVSVDYLLGHTTEHSNVYTMVEGVLKKKGLSDDTMSQSDIKALREYLEIQIDIFQKLKGI